MIAPHRQFCRTGAYAAKSLEIRRVLLENQTQTKSALCFGRRPARRRAAFFAAGKRRRVAASARNASQPSGARPEAQGSWQPLPRRRPPEAPRSGAARGRAPAATMGKGEGAVDKNMRKELSLEIDGHASRQYVNVHRRDATHRGRPTPREVSPTTRLTG